MVPTKLDKAQQLADKFTNEVMSERYGERFTKCKNLEEDETMNGYWEYLNERFYELIVPII